jgi:hypothetical protein
MFSIIIYGRNDSHGYNLHKRVAISLNAMSEVMTDKDDEIVFVDYNTPDDLPTFAEAIQDTLTQTAKKRTRVLRVRASQHRRFASKTHLVALEPISRNVALRRSNPNNRWILSTNTDMIFVPNVERESLSDICGDLEDGFYHLPRFELPECLWESFDRKDGRGIIRQTRDWAKRFHLNEIVYGHHDNLYDAPGDFQLGLREDYFRIHGFNEEMILGWHVDSNIARRMRLLRGDVKTVVNRMTGYHCDHTRQATLMHRRDRVMNDQDRFINNVNTPFVPEQAETWGMPNEKIEEINLNRGVTVRYIEALEHALKPGPDKYYESWYNPNSYNDLAYPHEHVLPYLVDLLSCAPIGGTVAYAGVRSDMFELVHNAVRVLDPTAQVIVPKDFDWLKGAEAVCDDKWLADGMTFLFEVGELGETDNVEEGSKGTRTARVLECFKIFSDAEEERQVDRGLPPRRILAVNAIHNFFEHIVSDCMSNTTTPYSSRTRHGYIMPERLPRTPPKVSIDWMKAGEQLSFSLGRSYAAPTSELKYIIELASTLELPEDLKTLPWRKALSNADLMIAFLRDRRLSAFLAHSEADIGRIAEVLEAHRPSNEALRRMEGIPIRAGGSHATSRLANIDDWERPGWLRTAKRYFGGRRVYDTPNRSLWTWERVSLIEQLECLFQPGGNGHRATPRILVVANSSEYLAACLIDMGAEVDFVDPIYLLEGDNRSVDWRSELSWIPMKLSRPIGSLAERVKAGQSAQYDAIVCPQNAMFVRGRASFADIFGELHPLLKSNGLFSMACTVHLDSECDEVSLARHLIEGGAFSADYGRMTGYEPVGETDMSISRRTLDVTQELGQLDDSVQPFMFGWSGLGTTAIWCWRKALGANASRLGISSLLYRRPGVPINAILPTEPVAIPVKTARQPVELELVAATASAPSIRHETGGPNGVESADRLAPSNMSDNCIGSAFARLRASAAARKTPRGIQITRDRIAGVFAYGELGLYSKGTYEIIFQARVKRALAGQGDALTVEIRHGGSLVYTEALSASLIEQRGRCSALVTISDLPGSSGTAPLEVAFRHHANADIELTQLLVY